MIRGPLALGGLAVLGHFVSAHEQEDHAADHQCRNADRAAAKNGKLLLVTLDIGEFGFQRGKLVAAAFPVFFFFFLFFFFFPFFVVVFIVLEVVVVLVVVIAAAALQLAGQLVEAEFFQEAHLSNLPIEAARGGAGVQPPIRPE